MKYLKVIVLLIALVSCHEEVEVNHMDVFTSGSWISQDETFLIAFKGDQVTVYEENQVLPYEGMTPVYSGPYETGITTIKIGFIIYTVKPTNEGFHMRSGSNEVYLKELKKNNFL